MGYKNILVDFIGLWDFLRVHTSLNVNCKVHCCAYGLKIHITLMEIDQEIISTGILFF